ncbi:polyprenol phosphomannose-dependent alpha 1,6 mannosyltransferase MptB [Streptomyces sp. NPDC088354]|uniref:polyprenol phosphomannose-dependent alpha 1,6 mannosyltransferase MptB n=1 Tax=unclassified Streptomyces TaxID=2593676 RepID=UPI0029A0D282|nr:polyprenol phosphomannose-dependent alpha 1,6 mannosyltransferase MptB [Streptomyces sp. MI02-7b]MDX3073630.1 polyprenol phosphomannose-dependent alpha 1,6 mannosyltransferase MptB [Streptomyces sp. MI02-7b]
MTRTTALGLAGTVALAVGGRAAGALPVRDGIALPRGEAAIGLLVAYFGLGLLIAAWWQLGRLVRGPRPPTTRSLLTTFAVWAAPLLLAPPLFSRDVYSYLAQGAMVSKGIDAYTYGPSVLGGAAAAEVPAIWRDTPAPYGPAFLALARLSAHAGITGMRALALLGVALLATQLPRLARRCGADPAQAVWLGALNPLVLLHLVAGAHNDAVMLGLLGAGLGAALARRPVVAAVLVTLAALVKAPAALGLLVVATLWAEHLEGRWRLARTGAGVAAVAGATTVGITAVTGVGYGWIGALSTPASASNWSLVNTMARFMGTPHTWRVLSLVAVALAIGAVWLFRRRLGPVYALGLSLLAVALLGPAIRPWYLLWGLVPLAVAAPDGRVRRTAAVGSAVLALAVLPNGFPATVHQVVLATAGAAAALLPIVLLHLVRLLRPTRPAPAP